MQRSYTKTPHSSIVVYQERSFFVFASTRVISKTFLMKLLSESIKSFVEGFVSFYTSIYQEMRRW